MALVRAASPLPTRFQSPLPAHNGLRSLTPSRLPTSQSAPSESLRASLLGRVDSHSPRPAFVVTAATGARTATGASSGASSHARSRTPAPSGLRSGQADCFTTLGLPPSASASEIRQAYRSLAKVYHPDMNKDGSSCSANFLELRSAYESCLSHDARRCQSAPRKARQAADTSLDSLFNDNVSTVGRASAFAGSSSRASAVPKSGRRASRRQDSWDDIWDDMLASPKSSRRRR